MIKLIEKLAKEKKYLNKFRNESGRLATYDYGSPGYYFVTIETFNLKKYFGELVRTGNCPSMQHTEIGHKATEYWDEIPNHFPFVKLDVYTIMPNHIHGILFFDKEESQEWTPNQFGIQSQNLGSVIRAYKSTLKRYANQHHIEFKWKERYHDIIIRNETSLNNIRNYIINNPTNWLKKYSKE